MPIKVPGYHYAASDDGQLVVQMDEPYAGAVTFSWNPSDTYAPKVKSVEYVIPADLWEKVLHSYTREALSKKP